MTATASLAGNFAYPGMSAYSASKSAVISLGRCLAVELFPDIRVNMVGAGGGRDSQLLSGVPGLEGSESGDVSMRAATHPFGTNTARQRAYAHLFLVSEESGATNGQLLICDNGATVAAPPTMAKMALDHHGVVPQPMVFLDAAAAATTN